MAKRRDTGATGHGWFAQQWLETLDRSQADVCRALGWSKAKGSELISGKQRYNQENVEELAGFLHLSPYELLLHPDDAMKIRQIRQTARALAEVNLLSDGRSKGGVSDAPEAVPHPKRKAAR